MLGVGIIKRERQGACSFLDRRTWEGSLFRSGETVSILNHDAFRWLAVAILPASLGGDRVRFLVDPGLRSDRSQSRRLQARLRSVPQTPQTPQKNRRGVAELHDGAQVPLRSG